MFCWVWGCIGLRCCGRLDVGWWRMFCDDCWWVAGGCGFVALVSVAWFIGSGGCWVCTDVGCCGIDSVCLGLCLLICLDDFGCDLLVGRVECCWVFGCWFVRRSWWRCNSWCFDVAFWLRDWLEVCYLIRSLFCCLLVGACDSGACRWPLGFWVDGIWWPLGFWVGFLGLLCRVGGFV